jgi:hypothetical protein
VIGVVDFEKQEAHEHLFGLTQCSIGEVLFGALCIFKLPVGGVLLTLR